MAICKGCGDPMTPTHECPEIVMYKHGPQTASLEQYIVQVEGVPQSMQSIHAEFFREAAEEYASRCCGKSFIQCNRCDRIRAALAPAPETTP